MVWSVSLASLRTIVSRVTSGLVRFRLPPRDIAEPKNVTKSVIRIYVLIVVIVMALLLALNRHSFGAIGAIIAVGLVALILGIETRGVGGHGRTRRGAPAASWP